MYTLDKLLQKQPHIETSSETIVATIINKRSKKTIDSMFAAYIIYHVAIKIFSSRELNYNDTQNTTPSKFNTD